MKTIDEMILERIDEKADDFQLSLNNKSKEALCELVKERIIGLVISQLSRCEMRDIYYEFDEEDE